MNRESWTVNCESWTVNREPWTVNCESWTVNCESWTVNHEPWANLTVVMMDGYNFSSIMLTFFKETSPLRTSAPHMCATMDHCYVPLSFQFQLALKLFNTSGYVNEILDFTPIHVALTHVHDVKKCLWVESLALQRTYGYFTHHLHVLLILGGERIAAWIQRCLVE